MMEQDSKVLPYIVFFAAAEDPFVPFHYICQEYVLFEQPIK